MSLDVVSSKVGTFHIFQAIYPQIRPDTRQPGHEILSLQPGMMHDISLIDYPCSFHINLLMIALQISRYRNFTDYEDRMSSGPADWEPEETVTNDETQNNFC